MTPRKPSAQDVYTDLSRAFPGIRFTVKGCEFANGDTRITASWYDGPLTADVWPLMPPCQENDEADRYTIVRVIRKVSKKP